MRTGKEGPAIVVEPLEEPAPVPLEEPAPVPLEEPAGRAEDRTGAYLRA
jgi:hypothetical protein